MYNSVGLIQDLLAVRSRLSTTTVLRPSRCVAESVPIVSIEGRVTSCKSESNYKKGRYDGLGLSSELGAVSPSAGGS